MTYSVRIILRYEIERLVNGEIKVRFTTIWNDNIDRKNI
ncbi:hypothetical protein KHA80_21190 [Anaerobacillus sp. HL2]|nr:hypothetical protein KHA80_21190 [Anaerobacillus sp. HL2]